MRRYSYFCRNVGRIDGHHCENDVIDAEVLIGLLNAAFVREAALNGILPKDLAQKNAECAAAEKAVQERECGEIRTKLSQAAYVKSQTYAKYREGAIGTVEYKEWKKKKQEEEERLYAALRAAEEKIDKIDAKARSRESFVRMFPESGMARGVDGELIPALIERMELYPGRRLKIKFRFDGQGILRTGKAGGVDVEM